MGVEQGDNGGYISDFGSGSDSGGGGGGGDTSGGDSFAFDYASLYGGASGDIPFAPYTPTDLNPPTLEPLPQAPSSGDLFTDYYLYYLDSGFDPVTAQQMATQDAAGGAIQTLTAEQGLPTQLPDIGQAPSFPYQTPFAELQQYQFPSFLDTSPAPAPPLPSSPAVQQAHLPPACPGGQYHPYPIGHPQQDICVPFPAPAPAPQQPTRPATPTSGGSSGAGGSVSTQKPPAAVKPPVSQTSQQCSTPGTVFDPRSGRCVPRAQPPTQAGTCLPGYQLNRATNECALIPAGALPEEQDILGELSKVPVWIWLALGALLFFGSGGEERKKVTVQHRRAS